MAIAVSCDECGKSYQVGDDKAGKKFKCRDCGAVVAIPAGDEAFADLEDDWETPPAPRSRPRPAAKGTSKKPASRSSSKSGGPSPALIIGGVGGVLAIVAALVAFFLLRKSEPAAPVAEVPPAAPALPPLSVDPLAYLPQETYLFAQLRPAKIAASPVAKAFPEAMARGPAAELMVGPLKTLDLRKVDLAAIYLTPFDNGPPLRADGVRPGLGPAAMFVRYQEPLDARKLVTDAKREVEQVSEQEHKGRKYLRIAIMDEAPEPDAAPTAPAAPATAPGAPAPAAPVPGAPAAPPGAAGKPKLIEFLRFACIPLDDRTVLIGHEWIVLRMLDGVAPGAVSERLKRAPVDSDLLVVTFPGMDKYSTRDHLSAARDLPGGEALLNAANEVQSVVFSVGLSGTSLASLSIEGKDDAVSGQLEGQIRDGFEGLKGLVPLFTADYRKPDAPAYAKDLMEFTDRVLAGVSVARTGRETTLTVSNPGGWEKVAAAAQAARAAQALAASSTTAAGGSSPLPTGPVEKLPAGAVLHLSFDAETLCRRGEKVIARDLSGSGQDAAIEGAKLEPGRFGAALSFDGNGKKSFLEGSDAKLPEGGSPSTLSVWFLQRDPRPRAFYGVFGYGKQEALRARGINVSTSTVCYYRWTESACDWHTPVSPGEWHHAAVVSDGTTSNLYLDGELKGTQTKEFKTVREKYRVGTSLDGSMGFKGLIDEVAVFDRALSADEVRSLFQRTPLPATSVPDLAGVPACSE